MAKFYAFPSQSASESCPALPRSVRVWGESLGDATARLAKALADDPDLAKAHPEFDEQKPEPKIRKKSSPSDV